MEKKKNLILTKSMLTRPGRYETKTETETETLKIGLETFITDVNAFHKYINIRNIIIQNSSYISNSK